MLGRCAEVVLPGETEGGAAPGSHTAPRGDHKRIRDSDSEDNDHDDDSGAEGSSSTVADGDLPCSVAARKVAKRMRAIGSFGEPGEHLLDPARSLMVEAQKATVAHTMAMKMERKLAFKHWPHAARQRRRTLRSCARA